MNLLDKYISKAVMSYWMENNDRVTVVALEERNSIIMTKETFELSLDGVKLWKLLNGRKKVRDVIKEYTQSMDIDFDENCNEILNYIQSLIKNGIIDFFDTANNV